MWRSPAFFQEFLNQQGMVGDLYDTIQEDDLSDAVFVALNILKKTGNLPRLIKDKKCISKSTTHRQQGNKFYKAGKFQRALEHYNKALMYAPKGTEELVFAYSNRSALLATCKMFDACLKDINTCFALGCPTQITNKLSKRREEAMKGIWMERIALEVRFSPFAEEYLDFAERRNPQISCASTNVGVIMESKVPKVVATRDVKVGKLLAREKAFVSQLDWKLMYSACYYCHKMALNLIPCEGCCSALFCGTNCQQKCMDEYHKIECQIIEIFGELLHIPVSKLAIKAAIKLRKQFKSWEEFNEATLSFGLKRVKESGINAIFDAENKFSLLNFKDDAVFKYGMVYNASFGCAILMHYLGQVSFLPTRAPDKIAAARGFSRLLMYFSLNLIQTQLSSAVSDMALGKTEFCDVANFGIFSFTGKLKAACNPNVLVVGLNNEVALIAIQPLKPGMELTVAYLGHWLDNHIDTDRRWRNLITLYRTACACPICNGDWKLLQQNAKLTEAHLRCVRKLNAKNTNKNYNSDDMECLFPKCCKTLAFLSDIPYSNEYADVYKLFRKCLLDIQNQYSANVMLDCIDDCN